MLTIKIERKAVLWLLLLACALVAIPSEATNSTTPSKPYSFSAGGIIRASEVSANFDTLYTELQGNVGTANLLDNAITTNKLAASAVTNAKVTDRTLAHIKIASSSSWRLIDKLKIIRASSTTYTITAGQVVLTDGTDYLLANDVSETLTITASGANGLDTGALPGANTGFSVYLIGKSDGTIDSLMSLSSTSPTMPSGYTFKRRIGNVIVDLLGVTLASVQNGNVFQIQGLRVSDGGVAATTTITARTWSSVFPTTAIYAFFTIRTRMTANGDGYFFMYCDNFTDFEHARVRATRAATDTLFDTYDQVILPMDTDRTYRYKNSSTSMANEVYITGWIDDI